jgi:hypothetical protein
MREPRGRRSEISASLREELPFFGPACAMGCAMEWTGNRVLATGSTWETHRWGPAEGSRAVWGNPGGQNEPTSSTLIPARFFPAGFRPT